MKKAAIALTIISCILSGMLWLLGILTLLFNILGLWGPWHLAGFGFIFFIPVPIVPAILSIIFSCIQKDRKLMILNSVSAAASVVFIFLTVFVSSTWFW